MSLILKALSAVLIFSGSAYAETYGTLMVVKGEVKVTSSKNKSAGLAKVGLKVFEGDEILSGADGRAKVVMSDRNVLNISPNSKIKISKYENDGQAKNVEIQVDYGKVRASVNQKYDGEKNKFNVKTPTAVAGVRGTDFLTSYDLKTKAASFVTFEGSVAVGNLGAGGAIMNPVYVNPGQQTEAKAGSPPEPPKAVPPETMKQMNESSKAESKESAGPSSPSTESKSAEKKDEKKDESKAEVKSEVKSEAKSEAKTDDKKPDSPKAESPRTPAAIDSSKSMVDVRDLRPEAGLPPAGSQGGVGGGFTPPPPPMNFNPNRDITGAQPPGGNQFVKDAITNGPADVTIKIIRPN